MRIYSLEVEGVGTLRVKRRTMANEMELASEYSRLTGGQELVNPETSQLARILSLLHVLVVEFPHGFDPDDLDPLDPASYEQMARIYGAVNAQENSFRGQRTDARSGNVGGGDLVVPPEVQPAVDRPTLFDGHPG